MKLHIQTNNAGNKKMFKKTISISAILFSVLFSAQEAGKAGSLLKNEASKTEMQIPQNNAGSTNRGGTPSNNNTGFRNPNQNPIPNGNNSPKNFGTPVYKWNQNRGYSEVFLRIPEYGYFSVEIGNQMISNDSGKYRFFDLSAGNNNISIYQNGFLIYRTRLNIRNNNRMVLDFFTGKGLYLLDTYPVQNKTYGFNEWDDIWNNPYNNHNYGNFGNNPYDNYGNSYGNNYGNYGMVMDSVSFNQFMNVLKKNTFENSKMDIIKQQSKTGAFTSQQIKSILMSLNYEANKLEMAKLLYRNCADKQNFFLVYDVFSFESSKKELMDFISNG
jgi:hypothetical protein